MRNRFDKLYKIPYSTNTFLIGRFDRLQVVQIFNIDFTEGFDPKDIDSENQLFTCLVDFKHCSWEEIGESDNLGLLDVSFYLVSSSRVIEERIYSDTNTFQIYQKEIVNDQVRISFKDSDLDTCVGLDRFAVYSEENIVSRIQYEKTGVDNLRRGEEYYATLGPLKKNAWFLNPPHKTS